MPSGFHFWSKGVCHILFSLALLLIGLRSYAQSSDSLTMTREQCLEYIAEHGAGGLISTIYDYNTQLESEEAEYILRCKNLYAACYALLTDGHYDSSIKLYQESADIAAAHQDTFYQLRMLSYVGNANLFKGDFHRALDVLLPVYSRLINIREKNNITIYQTLSFIIAAHYYLQNDEQMMTYLDKAEPYLEKIDDPDEYNQFANYKSLILVKQGRYLEAIKVIEEALDLIKKHDGKDVGYDLNNLYRSLSVAHGHLEQYDEALRYLDLAEKGMGYGTDWSMTPAIAMTERADLLLKKGDQAKSLEEAKRAMRQLGVEAWRDYDFERHPNLQYVLSAMSAYVMAWQASPSLEVADRKDINECYDKMLQVMDIALESFSDRRGAVLLSKFDHIYQNAVENTYELYKLTGDSDYLSKGMSYSLANRSQDIRMRLQASHESEELSKEEKVERDNNIAELSSLKLELLKAQVDRDVDRLALLADQYEALKSKNKRNGNRSEHPVISSAVVYDPDARSLSEDEAMINVYETSSHWYVWQHTDSDFSWRRYEVDSTWGRVKSSLAHEVGGRYDFGAIQSSLAFLTDEICQAYQSGARDIVMLGDNAIATIPMDVLVQCDGAGYSMSDLSMRYEYYVPGRSDRASTYDHLLTAWAPKYVVDPADSIKDMMISELVRSGRYNLPGALSEVKRITQIMDSESYIGASATKETFKRGMVGSRILHLSMHALMDRQQPELSKFLFANEHINDESSYLHAFELEEMDIDAELAVLSACETGLGVIQEGSGVMSLAKSFALAGVRSTVMTLWRIPDRSSSVIMPLFYENLKERMGKSDALAAAKREYVKSCVDPALRHPYYWAGFVLIGDNEPVLSNIERGNPLPWWTLGIALLVALLSVAFRQSRAQR